MEAMSRAPDVLEVLDRSERVEHWYRLGDAPLRIGRAYDNDVVLTDEHVCPYHAQLHRDAEGRFWLQDLGSLNGTFVGRSRKPVGIAELGEQAQFRLGETQLRFRSGQVAPAPTRLDRTAVSPLRHLRNPWVVLLCMVVLPCSLVLESWLGTTESLEPRRVLGDLVGPVVSVLTWAGLWSFASRLIVHRLRFGVHLGIACLALSMAFWADGVQRSLGFSFALDAWLVWLDPLAGLAVLSLALYAHLRFASALGRRRIAIASVCVAGLVVLASSYRSWLPDDEFNAQPRFHATLKPPAWRIVKAEPAEDFYARIRELEAESVE